MSEAETNDEGGDAFKMGPYPYVGTEESEIRYQVGFQSPEERRNGSACAGSGRFKTLEEARIARDEMRKELSDDSLFWIEKLTWHQRFDIDIIDADQLEDQQG